MTARLPQLLMAALLSAVFSSSAQHAFAQDASAPPATVLPPPRSDETPPPPPPRPPSAVGAPIPAPNPGPFAPPPPPDARDPIYQPRDPGFSGWGLYDLPSMPQQFWANVEVDIMKPHLKAALSNAVFFPDGSEKTVRPPSVPVGWTAAPRLEFGWSLPNSLGAFALWYRGFVTQGTEQATSLDGVPFSLRTRLDVNQAGLDYGTEPYSFAPRWFLTGRVGVAWADVFFDNQAISNLAIATPHTLYASNNYNGAGPHVRLDLRRRFALVPGLDFFGRGDFTVLVGQITQRFHEIDVNPDGGSNAGLWFEHRTQTVPVFNFQVGLAYTPPSWDRWRFSLGYEFEEWWFVGQIDLLDSRGQFTTNGVFLRAAVTF
jgi:hypothetical protein